MGRFHQRFTQSFYSCRSQKRTNWLLDCLFCAFEIYVKKAAHKMLMTLSPWVDFTNMYMRSIYARRSKRVNSLWLFELLGSVRVKAAHKMLMKLTLSLSLSHTHSLCICILLPLFMLFKAATSLLHISQGRRRREYHHLCCWHICLKWKLILHFSQDYLKAVSVLF